MGRFKRRRDAGAARRPIASPLRRRRRFPWRLFLFEFSLFSVSTKKVASVARKNLCWLISFYEKIYGPITADGPNGFGAFFRPACGVVARPRRLIGHDSYESFFF